MPLPFTIVFEPPGRRAQTHQVWVVVVRTAAVAALAVLWRLVGRYLREPAGLLLPIRAGGTHREIVHSDAAHAWAVVAFAGTATSAPMFDPSRPNAGLIGVRPE